MIYSCFPHPPDALVSGTARRAGRRILERFASRSRCHGWRRIALAGVGVHVAAPDVGPRAEILQDGAVEDIVLRRGAAGPAVERRQGSVDGFQYKRQQCPECVFRIDLTACPRSIDQKRREPAFRYSLEQALVSNAPAVGGSRSDVE
jgi:hypothetical protein